MLGLEIKVLSYIHKILVVFCINKFDTVDAGKSSTARILAAYAARLDRNPIFVDLDIGQGSITIPGCISAVPVEKLGISIEVRHSRNK